MKLDGGGVEMSSYNKLKCISVDALESAIAKVIGELTGVKYDCSI
ncbi:unnamed protein product [marine sediment metagenome]|uniref:Uncharacterized protein n=1 Tax=marine sediment metagenome TaxID=412755 RepID=X1IBZ2_9ZZZZ